MTGIVLCGGQSIRMGTDKGLLKHEGLTWTELAQSKLSSLKIPVIISVNEQQQAEYTRIFSSETIITDRTDLNIKGPLLGLLSCHLQFPKEDLFVLACDLIDMTTALLHRLYNQYLENKGEAYVFTTEGKLQPLCGIYAASGLKKIHALYVRQELIKFSMMHVLEQLQINTVQVESDEISFFANYNTPFK